MYKSTKETEDYLKRAGSASTRPSRRGTFFDIPEWAQRPEEYFNSIRNRYESHIEYVREIRAKLDLLKETKIAKRPSGKERIKLYENIKEMGALLQDLENRGGELRKTMEAASNNSWGTVFFYCAHQLLNRETFTKIQEEVGKILQRPRSNTTHWRIRLKKLELTEKIKKESME
jgi:hypothetical protein